MNLADYDPRLVELYDGQNPDGPDHEFYRQLADKHRARKILDLGCGTGILTVTLANKDRVVTGLDPSLSMVNFASTRGGAQGVRWIHGDSRSIPDNGYDLILMTGNVAQHIPDAQWHRTLADLRSAASPNARLAFESRNPLTRSWEQWALEPKTTSVTRHGVLEEWCTVEELGHGRILLRSYNNFLDAGELIIEDLTLHFRSQERIASDLKNAGFDVVNIFGDWAETPFDSSQRIMIFEAATC